MKGSAARFLATVVLLFATAALPPVARAASGQNGSKPAITSVEERRLLASMDEQRRKLAKRKTAVQRREAELKTLAAEVDKKLDELRRTREGMKALFDKVSAEKTQRLRQLGAMYGKMDPARAARIIKDLDQQLAVGILSAMKEKSAGRILAAMDRDRAARLTRAFSKVNP